MKALRLGLEVDQQVSTRDEVHLRERRVLRDVVAREHDELAQIRRHLKAGRPPHEEPLAALRAHVAELVLAVEADTRDLER